MHTDDDIVDESSDESFPASDPPSWTPTTGVGNPHKNHELIGVGKKNVVRVDNGRGDELREHLASHGIKAKVASAEKPAFEDVEILDAVDPVVLEAIMDEWEG